MSDTGSRIFLDADLLIAADLGDADVQISVSAGAAPGEVKVSTAAGVDTTRFEQIADFLEKVAAAIREGAFVPDA